MVVPETCKSCLEKEKSERSSGVSECAKITEKIAEN